MDKDEFNKRLEAFERRLKFLRAVRKGEARYRKVRVKQYHVRSYDVPSHWRYIPETKEEE